MRRPKEEVLCKDMDCDGRASATRRGLPAHSPFSICTLTSRSPARGCFLLFSSGICSRALTMLSIDFKSLLAPLLYVVIVFGGLYVFSTLYKRYYASTQTF